jgi:hypothetical protein
MAGFGGRNRNQRSTGRESCHVVNQAFSRKIACRALDGRPVIEKRGVRLVQNVLHRVRENTRSKNGREFDLREELGNAEGDVCAAGGKMSS